MQSLVERSTVECHSSALGTEAGAATQFIYGAAAVAEHRAALEAFQRRHSQVHLYQSLDWYDWHGKDGDLQPAITLRDGAVVASSLVRERRLPLGLGSVARVLWGPVAADLSILRRHSADLVQALRRQAVQVTVSPFLTDDAAAAAAHGLAEDGWRPLATGSWTYDRTLVVDLAQDLDTIRRGFRRSMRTQINKASRLDMAVETQPSPEDCRYFAELHDAMAAERGIAPLPEAVVSVLSRGTGGTLIPLIARYEGRVVAGIVLIAVGDRVIYEWGTVDRAPAYRNLPLSHRLHWEGIRLAQSLGYRYYDFGGYWGAADHAHPIDRFKTGFTRQEQRLVPEHARTLRPGRVWLLRQAIRMQQRAR